MARRQSRVMQPRDLERAVRSIAKLLDAEEVVIIGSQALLVARDDVASELRMSEEFDAYATNYPEWQRHNPGEEASEAIHAMLGEGSMFHIAHGFFVDGADVTTARLADEWRDRAVSRVFDVDGRDVRVIAPEPNDLVASKLFRGEQKDITFARLCLRHGLVKHDVVKERLSIIMPPEKFSLGLQRLANASRGSRTPSAVRDDLTP